MNVFGVGLPEIAVISALALIIFGPKRLPELGRTLGKTLKGLQSASTEFEKEIKSAMSDDGDHEVSDPIEVETADKSTQQSNNNENGRVNPLIKD